MSNKTGLYQSADGAAWQLVPGAPVPMKEEEKPKMETEASKP